MCSPEAFVAIAARICPNDRSDAAIREGLPDADQMQPGAVFQHVLSALRTVEQYPYGTAKSVKLECE